MHVWIWGVLSSLAALIISQPVISPHGIVNVSRGENLTLTCSYEEKPSDLGTVCKWSEILSGFNYPISRMYLLYNKSTCMKTFPDDNLYGFGCHGDNSFSITIFNVQEGTNGTQWICEQMVGKDNMALSLPVTLNVIDSGSNSLKKFYTTHDVVITTEIEQSVTTMLVSNISHFSSTGQNELDSDTPDSKRDVSRLKRTLAIGIEAFILVSIIIGVGAAHIVVHQKNNRRSKRHVWHGNTNIELDAVTVGEQNNLRSVSQVAPTYEKLQIRSEALYERITANLNSTTNL